MSNGQTAGRATSYRKPGEAMRMAAVIILIIGLVSAGLVYGLSKPAEISPDDMATPETSKRSARDVSLNYGQMGAFSYNLGEDLKDPRIQAGIIAAVSIFVAGACFYIAHLQTRDPHNYRPDTKT